MLFSRSPIVASKLFTSRQKPSAPGTFENYYGKTAGMQAPSEANHLWNQWVNADASGFRTIMESTGATKMAEFLKLFSAQHKLPLIIKNNNANAFADTIMKNLDDCYFICLRRKADYLAQSLISARLEINGDITQSYGVVDVASDQPESDPVKQVVSQIRFLDSLALKQQALVGKDRFWIVDYEDFCENPEALANRVSKEILSSQDDNAFPAILNPIANNNIVKDPVLFASIQTALKEASDY